MVDPSHALRGRRSECAALDAVLDAVRAGQLLHVLPGERQSVEVGS